MSEHEVAQSVVEAARRRLDAARALAIEVPSHETILSLGYAKLEYMLAGRAAQPTRSSDPPDSA